MSLISIFWLLRVCLVCEIQKCSDRKELGKALMMIGICTTEHEVSKAVDEIDRGGDGMVQWNEFLHFMARKLTDASLVNAEIEMAFEGA